MIGRRVRKTHWIRLKDGKVALSRKVFPAKQGREAVKAKSSRETGINDKSRQVLFTKLVSTLF